MELARAGYEHVTAVDRDPLCVMHMQKRYAAVDAVRWLTFDLVAATVAQPLDDGSIQLIVDKGTLDCALVPRHQPCNPCCVKLWAMERGRKKPGRGRKEGEKPETEQNEHTVTGDLYTINVNRENKNSPGGKVACSHW